MKLIFSLILVGFSSSCLAAMISIQFHSSHQQNAKQIKQIFIKRYSIPKEIIKMNMTEECKAVDQRFLELCINKKGELLVLSNSNILKIKKSLKTFSLEAKND